MRRKIVFGNWKLNGGKQENATLISELVNAPAWGQDVEVVVLPPFAYLQQAVEQCHGTGVRVGAQDVSAYRAGAYTGEVSAGMLADLGCVYALVGHSERRSIFGERDEEIAEKVVRCVEAGVRPVVCVGERLDERDSGRAVSVVEKQVSTVLGAVGAQAGCVFAYEPVWAIGAGKTPVPADIAEIHRAIRGCCSTELAVVYGGSVVARNAAEILAMPEVDGVLVGGASLRAAEFLAIIQAANGAVLSAN